MLVLTETEGANLQVGDTVITVIEIRSDKVRLGIGCDDEVVIRRWDIVRRTLLERGWLYNVGSNTWQKGNDICDTRSALLRESLTGPRSSNKG